ncbi:hypothetical protein [Burkholderia diffusa]|uniref:hypothetical protein n=1 Tax=Burkholderia diffusa TaxID=488732 RepID=UPI000A7D88C5|nr:hypothetical protein [Burkholderia diffusa]
MKKGIAALFASVTLVATTHALANDAHHPDSQPATKAGAVTQMAPTAPTNEQFETARRQMQKMLAQMDQIRQTQDPAERQRLMDEHIRTMQDTMQSMHAMGAVR